MQFTPALGREKFFCQALRVAQIKFGTDGWRAVIAEDFTFANVARVALAFGHDAQAWAKYQCPSRAQIFKETADDSHIPWVEDPIATVERSVILLA